ncbi:sugar transferase [Thiohalomonas denitrificans]|uniref:sugar transferase n=1 Tax=Thiohalomonas denitrificans TaxID=415747 RepID=UPI0026ECCD7B|nr:sugar transferase [Thiohalomonas denitrificans]
MLARKRIFDVLVASIFSLLLLPLLALISLAILVSIGRPILFSHIRPGLHGQPFTLYKFRTMTDARGQNGDVLSDSERLTGIGAFLRITSLDELPELYNVLKGDMSLVGPRPLLIRYLPYYTPSENKRHDVRPGITGLAQINGRHLLGWDQRLQLDVWYVENWSMMLDLKILWRTAFKVITKEDSLADPTMAGLPDLDEERRSRLHRRSLGASNEATGS